MSWYALRTSPQKELALAGSHDAKGEWVAGILERKGYEVFTPIETRWQRQFRKGKRRPVSRPMLPGYIFVAGPVDWPSLLSENYITGVIGRDGMPWPISDFDMQRLRSMADSATPHRRSVNQRRTLHEGDKVEVIRGPYSGMVSEVKGLSGRKAKILLMLFGAQREVYISHEDLEAA